MKSMWPHLMAIFFITFFRGLGEAKTLAVMTGVHPAPPARESVCFFGFSTAFNHSMVLTELFMSFNQVGQLYNG